MCRSVSLPGNADVPREEGVVADPGRGADVRRRIQRVAGQLHQPRLPQPVPALQQLRVDHHRAQQVQALLRHVQTQNAAAGYVLRTGWHSYTRTKGLINWTNKVFDGSINHIPHTKRTTRHWSLPRVKIFPDTRLQEFDSPGFRRVQRGGAPGGHVRLGQRRDLGLREQGRHAARAERGGGAAATGGGAAGDHHGGRRNCGGEHEP